MYWDQFASFLHLGLNLALSLGSVFQGGGFGY